MSKKIMKVVTITIKADRLLRENNGAIYFRPENPGGLYFFLYKKQIHDFKKVITWFPHWKGRKLCKAYKFKMSLFLYEKKSYIIDEFSGSIIVENTHEQVKI